MTKLDFVKAVGGKLLIAVSNCAGDHPSGEPLDLSQALTADITIRPDVFSYHYYNGISERGGSFAPGGHWSDDTAHTDEHCGHRAGNARRHGPLWHSSLSKKRYKTPVSSII